jgi:Ca2+-binding EF-hand superfamily protein
MRKSINKSRLSLQDAFTILDRNGNGILDANGVVSAFRDASIFKTHLNYGVNSRQDVQEMIHSMSGSNTCTYDDFVECMRVKESSSLVTTEAWGRFPTSSPRPSSLPGNAVDRALIKSRGALGGRRSVSRHDATTPGRRNFSNSNNGGANSVNLNASGFNSADFATDSPRGINSARGTRKSTSRGGLNSRSGGILTEMGMTGASTYNAISPMNRIMLEDEKIQLQSLHDWLYRRRMTITSLFHLMDDDEDGLVTYQDALRVLGGNDVDGIGKETEVRNIWSLVSSSYRTTSTRGATSYSSRGGGGGSTRVNFRTGRRVAWDDQQKDLTRSINTNHSVDLQTILTCWMRPFPRGRSFK